MSCQVFCCWLQSVSSLALETLLAEPVRHCFSFPLFCHPNLSVPIAQYCILKPYWQFIPIYIFLIIVIIILPRYLHPKNRQVNSSSPNTRSPMAMYNHNLGLYLKSWQHPSNKWCSSRENASVIKHVMKRGALSSLLPVEVNCRRFSKSLVSFYQAANVSPGAQHHEKWHSPDSKPCTQSLWKPSHRLRCHSSFTAAYLLLQLCH